MNFIVYTQDLPGERDWLNTTFPNCQNVETPCSGKWPSSRPTDLEQDIIWEIPPEISDDFESCSGKKIKSLYDPNFDQIDNRWTDSDEIIIKDGTFQTRPRSNKSVLFHLPRSGTKFLESILSNQCLYERMDTAQSKPDATSFDYNNLIGPREHDIPHNRHLQSPPNSGPIFYDLIKNHLPDIFFVYRNNWWEWFTSYLIMCEVGPFHYDTNKDFNQIPLITITKNHFNQAFNTVKYAFNNLCQLRIEFPNLNFFIFEHSDLIKHQHLTNHKQIDYDKRLFFTNLETSKIIFEKEYLSRIKLYENRCLGHLEKMLCQRLTNFDKLISA